MKESNSKDLRADVYQVPPLPNGEHPSARLLRRYRKIVSRLATLITIAFTVYVLIPQKGGRAWAAALAELISAEVSSAGLRALLYTGIVGALYGIITLPLSFLSGYVIEKRFGLSTQTLWGWISDQLKGIAVAIVLGTVVVLGVTAAILWAGSSWWWVTAIGAVIFGVLLTRLAPQLIIPLFFKMKRLDSPELQRRFTELGQKTGTPVLGVFEIDMSRRTRAANAAVVGFGKSRRAVVGDTLLSQFTLEEAEFVLTHELAHHRYHDLWIGIAVGSVVTFVALAVADWALGGASVFGMRDGFNPLVLFLIGVVISVVEAILSPIARLLSRIAETRADRFAAQTTQNPKAGAAAFRKLGYQNLAVFEPPAWEEALFHTHPSIGKRIRRLEALT